MAYPADSGTKSLHGLSLKYLAAEVILRGGRVQLEGMHYGIITEY